MLILVFDCYWRNIEMLARTETTNWLLSNNIYVNQSIRIVSLQLLLKKGGSNVPVIST